MQDTKLPLPREDLGLFTDLYELTMAQAFFQQGMSQPATFSLFVRNYPPQRGYLVFAGLEDVLEYLANLHFSSSSLDYLRSTGIFQDDFLDYLSEVHFTGSVRAMAEGRVMFINEPPIEVTAPIVEAQLAETFIVNQVNLQSLLATKAARCVWAAQGRTVSDFASRRAQGIDAALKMARCSYIAGFQSTSNVLAGQRYNIPPAGTMAHSFISSFPSQKAAFQAYAEAFPGRAILLLDTYDTVDGAHQAVEVAKEMEERGHRLLGVRLDSGDFLSLSRQVRSVLNEAGLDYVRIVVSGGLDEYEIIRLLRDQAPIDIFGVGTKAGVSADAPWSDMAYKLVCYDGRPVMKLSTDKASWPGAKQVFRVTGPAGIHSHDIVGLDDDLDGGEPLLSPVMEKGTRTRPNPALMEIRDQFNQDFDKLEDRYKALADSPEYPVKVSPRLDRLINEVRGGLLRSL
jgi:nicotinate phosphoribosyltransferase